MEHKKKKKSENAEVLYLRRTIKRMDITVCAPADWLFITIKKWKEGVWKWRIIFSFGQISRFFIPLHNPIWHIGEFRSCPNSKPHKDGNGGKKVISRASDDTFF